MKSFILPLLCLKKLSLLYVDITIIMRKCNTECLFDVLCDLFPSGSNKGYKFTPTLPSRVLPTYTSANIITVIRGLWET